MIDSSSRLLTDWQHTYSRSEKLKCLEKQITLSISFFEEYSRATKQFGKMIDDCKDGNILYLQLKHGHRRLMKKILKSKTGLGITKLNVEQCYFRGYPNSVLHRNIERIKETELKVKVIKRSGTIL